jgi:hypothetical protein
VSSSLRPIKAIVAPGLKGAPIEYKPEIKNIKLMNLRINDEYQRALSVASINRIRKIAKEWNWAKFHVPVVTLVENETDIYEVLDGQHTCIGARTHGGITELPCLVVLTRDIVDKAEAFVGLNRDKLAITPLNTFWARITAKEEIATEVLAGVIDAGAKIVKRPPPYGDFSTGEIIAVSTLDSICKKGGRSWVKRVCYAGVECGLAPISASYLRAFCTLLLDGGKNKIDAGYEESLKLIKLTVIHLGADQIERRASMRRVDNEGSLAFNIALEIKDYIDVTYREIIEGREQLT